MELTSTLKISRLQQLDEAAAHEMENGIFPEVIFVSIRLFAELNNEICSHYSYSFPPKSTDGFQQLRLRITGGDMIVAQMPYDIDVDYIFCNKNNVQQTYERIKDIHAGKILEDIVFKE